MKQALEKLSQEGLQKWPEFFKTIEKELYKVEENLNINLPIKANLLKNVIHYIFTAGGKRIRPALCLLMANATGGVIEKHIKLAELTELIHTASLIHDDIIDSANLRRGKETINNLWNDKISVIAGDFLFGQASVKLGELEETEIVKIYANVLSDLCEGEIEQFSLKFNTEISIEAYIRKSIAKTASLFSAATKSAAILNKKTKDEIEHASRFGLYLGIAFQVVDDILDFTGNNFFGKELAKDLKEGIITAPVIFSINSVDERSRQLKELIENRFNNNSEDFHRTLKLILELGGYEKAKQLANEYLLKAKECLSFINNKEAKENLIKAADYVVSRL